MHANIRAFSLIELLIALAIVGILAAVCYPAYQQYVLRSYRAEAMQQLLQIANIQEQQLADFGQYTTELSNLGLTSNVTASGRYQISILLNNAASEYQLIATAVGVQSADSSCPSFELNHLGQQNATNSVALSCWQ